jgi:hypothetical protein
MVNVFEIPETVDKLLARVAILEQPRPAAGDVLAAVMPEDIDTVPNGNWKKPVRVATTAALPANAGSGTGTLEATANAALTIDSVAVAVGNRVLVKNQAAPKDNGIYEVLQAGGAAEKWKLTRTADANTAAELEEAEVFAHEGTLNIHVPFACTAIGVITVNTTNLPWVEAGNVNLAGAQTISGGKTFSTGLKSPNLLSGQETGTIGKMLEVASKLVRIEQQVIYSQGSPNLEAAEYSPYEPPTQRAFYVLNPTLNTVVNSWKQPGGGTIGEVLVLFNPAPFTITLTNENPPVETAPKWLCPGKANVVLGQNNAVTVVLTGLGWAFIGKV